MSILWSLHQSKRGESFLFSSDQKDQLINIFEAVWLVSYIAEKTFSAEWNKN